MLLAARGKTVAEILQDLDSQFPGLRFRIIDEQDQVRPHMRLYLGDHFVEDLNEKTKGHEELNVLHALSGG